MRQKSSGNTYDTFAWQGFNDMKTQDQPCTGLFYALKRDRRSGR